MALRRAASQFVESFPIAFVPGVHCTFCFARS
jgi:hypothetical protein